MYEADAVLRTCLRVRPFFDRLHIQPLAEELSDVITTQRDAPIFKTGYTTPTRITRGLVIECGPEVRDICAGDVVRFSDSCGRCLNANESREYLIRVSDIVEANDRLIGDVILVDPVVPEFQFGLVTIPSYRPEVPEDGEVIDIGPGRLLKSGERIKMRIAIGDRVLFPRHCGQEVIRHGKAYLAMRYDDLCAVMEKC